MKLKGKKTYLASAGAVLAALAGYLTGEMSVAEAVNAAMMGIGLGTLRLATASKGIN